MKTLDLLFGGGETLGERWDSGARAMPEADIRRTRFGALADMLLGTAKITLALCQSQ